jgi:AraC-like DNA-binding protein
MQNTFYESKQFSWAAGGLFAIHHHFSAQPDLLFCRLPMPWLCVTLRLQGNGQWRPSTTEHWQDMPSLALRGLFDKWSEGRDMGCGPQEYLVALIEPWAARAFFPGIAEQTRNAILGLSLPEVLHRRLVHSENVSEKCALFEAWLRQQFCAGACASDKVVKVFRRLQENAGAISVNELSQMASRSTRRINEAIFSASGIGPKQYAKLLRFGLALSTLHAKPWVVSEAAGVRPNYYDQSHMIREFRQFTGITPGAYQARKRLDPRTVFTI